jgi:hypothetical protein
MLRTLRDYLIVGCVAAIIGAMTGLWLAPYVQGGDNDTLRFQYASCGAVGGVSILFVLWKSLDAIEERRPKRVEKH